MDDLLAKLKAYAAWWDGGVSMKDGWSPDAHFYMKTYCQREGLIDWDGDWPGTFGMYSNKVRSCAVMAAIMDLEEQDDVQASPQTASQADPRYP